MTIGIIGLGLIGGSLAKAFRARTNHTVWGWDRDVETMKAAQQECGLPSPQVECGLGSPHSCDALILALPPKATREFLATHAERIPKGTLVVDCCGVKRNICAEGFALAQKHGFDFIDGHPMAGREYAGFQASQENLFERASMILVPKCSTDALVCVGNVCSTGAPTCTINAVTGEGTCATLLERAKEIFLPLGFRQIVVTTAEEHDTIIALTSQLAHVVSNAYVKSPRAQSFRGFSAGSYADLTRVARLNEKLWTELFLENGDNLVAEIDFLVQSLTAYRDAIASGKSGTLEALLRHGRECKERQE